MPKGATATPYPPVTAQLLGQDGQTLPDETIVALELEDGSIYQGFSFGAKKTISGELVFQTGKLIPQELGR